MSNLETPTSEAKEELSQEQEILYFTKEQNKVLDGFEMTISDNQMLIESLAEKAEGGITIPDFQSEATEAIKKCTEELQTLED